MSAAAFTVLALVLTAYVLLDGYDLGVGAMHLILARTDEERSASLATIGPFWSGNEVVLVAAGALLFAFFPQAYASAFSGFYLPLIIVLWLLMGRGMAIELRNYFPSDLWHGFWDAIFAGSSGLLAATLGVSLGNLLRGVPFGSGEYFAGTFGFLLNPYALLVGALAFTALAMHGAAFVAWRSHLLEARAVRAIRSLAILVLALYVATTWATLRIHPPTFGPLLWIAPIVGVLSLAACALVSSRALRFCATSIFLVALMSSAAGTLFPYLLPAFPIGSGGIDIYNAAPSAPTLETGLIVFGAGLLLVVVYATLAARRLLRRTEDA